MPNKTVEGFVEEIRDLGGLKFIKLYTKDGYVQITINKKTADEKLVRDFATLTRQSCIKVTGEEKELPKSKINVEIHPKTLYIYSIAATSLPLEPSGKTSAEVDTRFKWRVLDLRDEKKRAIFTIQTALEHYAREYFTRNQFIEIHSPKLLGAPSESGAELFELRYFGKKAYLAQSPQFYKQMAICAGFNRVFEIGPVFRANPSFTYRHDTEFTSLDVEIGYIESYQDVIKFEQEWLTYMITKLKEYWGDMIKKNFDMEITVPKTPFPQVKMTEAYEIVEKHGGKVKRGEDLDSEGEKILGKYVKEKFGHDFVYLTEFPVSVRPFYHMRDSDNPQITYSADLLFKGLEITTLAQREHRHDVLLKQAKEKGLSQENMEFYLNFFKYGAPSQGGFGFGLTRILMQLLGFKNVREVTFVPRDPKTLWP